MGLVRWHEEAFPFFRGKEGHFAVLHPGAGDGRRRWPPEKFARLGMLLLEAGEEVVVVGAGEERPLVDEVAGRMGGKAIDLWGKLSVGGLVGLLSMYSIMVGNDSGPLHLAAAVGAPVVGIFWCGNAITSSTLTRTRARPVLSWQLECPVCGVNCIYGSCDHHESFVDSITVEEVAEQAMELLGNRRKSKGEG